MPEYEDVYVLPVLDETGQDMAAAIRELKSVIQPTNVCVDLDVSLEVSGWSNSAPYVYNWMNNKVTTECAVKVNYLEGAEDTDELYIGYEKIVGGIQFESPTKPTAAIPVRIHIVNAEADSITNIDDEMVSSDVISGTSNVKQALTSLKNADTTLSEQIVTLQDEGVYYGTCDTAAATRDKVVTCANFPSALKAGQKLSVKFTYGDESTSYARMTVNSLSRKNIQFVSGSTMLNIWRAGEVVDFVYDGTAWIVVNGGAYNKIATERDSSVHLPLQFQVNENSSVTLSFTTEWAYSFLLVSTYTDITNMNGYLFFVNGYVSASRGIAQKLCGGNNISINMSVDAKSITILNSSSNAIKFTVVPFTNDQTFSVS